MTVQPTVRQTIDMYKYPYPLLWLFLFVSMPSSLYADNNPVCIKITESRLKEKQVLFGSYFNGQAYIIDSLYLSSNGTGVFRREEKYPEGEYFLQILIDTESKSDLLVNFLLADEQDFSITINTSDIADKTQIAGAAQSEVLLNYSQFLRVKRKERSRLVDDFFALPEGNRDTAKIKSQLDYLDKEVKLYRENLNKEYQGKWVASFVKGMEPITTGPYPAPGSRDEFEKEFRYKKIHFFDNIDLQDRRFWWTSFFPQKVVDYMEKQVEPHLDSLANAASQLVARTMGDSLCFQLMLNKLMNYSLSSKKMGMENIWMKLLEDYYHKGLVIWKDSVRREAIETEYMWLKDNRIGQTARNLDLLDVTGNPVELHQLGVKYTLLYLYEPSCGHCAEMTPKLYDQIYKKYADKGLDIVAMCIIQDEKEWISYINEHHLVGTHWHNVWDPSARSAFWLYYDIRTTPGIYLLDENKKIIAKKIDIDIMEQLLHSLVEANY